MKRLWITAGILILLCAAALVNVAFLNGMTEEITASLLQAQELAEGGDWEEAASLTIQADQQFRGQTFYLHITLRHSDIDEVEIAFQEVEQLLAHRERLGEYAAANARLVARLELLAESEHVTLRNIL